MTKWGMVIDLNKCIACEACTVACKVEHTTPDGVYWSRVVSTEQGQYPNVVRVAIPMPCMHCEDAPCVKVCPTEASYKRPDGIVLINYDKCIGCQYCIAVCPYGARTFVENIGSYFSSGPSVWEQLGYYVQQSGVVEKCTLCSNRIDQGVEPACVQTCPAFARYFGDLDDPNSQVSQMVSSGNAVRLLDELGTKPSVYYIPPPKPAVLYQE
jgi:molybdopterin-containing oxidoreductase family iron-sulfur binding subunit